MKKTHFAYIVVFICILLGTLLYYPTLKHNQEVSLKRKELSRTMNVSLKDYPYLPDDYFPYILQPGMSIEEVHQIVIGYEKVFHISDNGYKAEVYYFFSQDDDLANRIEIMYNDNYELRKIMQEDESSRTITVGGWDVGLLRE